MQPALGHDGQVGPPDLACRLVRGRGTLRGDAVYVGLILHGHRKDLSPTVVSDNEDREDGDIATTHDAMQEGQWNPSSHCETEPFIIRVVRGGRCCGSRHDFIA